MQEKRTAIRSLFEDDVALEEEIDRFVIGLAESIDRLQDAQADGKLDELGDLAHALAESAIRVGYPALADVARKIHDTCGGAEPDTIVAYLVELTEIGRCVRLGHRGAAS